MRNILQIAKAEKSGGMFPPHPTGFGLTRKRVRPSARRWRRLAKGPPQRHTEPRRGEGGHGSLHLGGPGVILQNFQYTARMEIVEGSKR